MTTKNPIHPPPPSATAPEATRLWLINVKTTLTVFERGSPLRSLVSEDQRVFVRPLADTSEEVRQAAGLVITDALGTSQATLNGTGCVLSYDIVSCVPVTNLAQLALALLTLDGTDAGRSPLAEPDALPTRLVIELAYDDLSPSQHTPSRAEALMFSCRTLAEQAGERVQAAYAHDWRVSCYVDDAGRSSSCTEDVDSGVRLVKDLLYEHYGEGDTE